MGMLNILVIVIAFILRPVAQHFAQLYQNKLDEQQRLIEKEIEHARANYQRGFVKDASYINADSSHADLGEQGNTVPGNQASNGFGGQNNAVLGGQALSNFGKQGTVPGNQSANGFGAQNAVTGSQTQSGFGTEGNNVLPKK